MRGGAEQIAEATHRKRSNGLAIETGEQKSIVIFVRKDAEMVLPKIDHRFIELPVAVDCAQEFRALQLGDDHLRILRWGRGLRSCRTGLLSCHGIGTLHAVRIHHG